MHYRTDTRNAVKRLMLVAALFGICAPADAISFRFSPANISVQAQPGEVINRTLTITLGKESAPARFRARIEDWWRSADNRQTFYAEPGTLARSCGKWCTINPAEATVKPGEAMTIKLSIRVPDSIKPGGYWGALTVDEVRDPMQSKTNGIGMIFRGSMSMGIFIEVPTATRVGSISSVAVDGQRVALTMRNDGNVPLRVSATYEFYRTGEEKPVASVVIGGECLLPEPVNTCEFSRPLPAADALPSGKYKVRVLVDIGLDHLLGAEKEIEITRSDSH